MPLNITTNSLESKVTRVCYMRKSQALERVICILASLAHLHCVMFAKETLKKFPKCAPRKSSVGGGGKPKGQNKVFLPHGARMSQNTRLVARSSELDT